MQNVSIQLRVEKRDLPSFFWLPSFTITGVLVLHLPILSLGLRGAKTGNGKLIKSNMAQ